MNTAPEIFQAALAQHRAGRLVEAAQLYQRVLSVEPRHSAALHLLGVAAFQLGQVDQAAEIISQAIRVDGSQAQYHASLGDVLRAQNRQSDAKACFERAISLDPNSPLAYYSLALVHRAEGNLPAAIQCCRQAVTVRPDFAEVHNDLGNLLRQQGQPDEAQPCYERAIAANPAYVDAYVNLASLAREQKQFDRAGELLERALAMAPESTVVLNQLGDLACQCERFVDAERWFRKSLSIAPETARTHLKLGAALQEQQRLAEAAESYRHSLAIDASVAETHFNLATVCEALGQVDEAIAGYQRAIALDPGYFNAHVNLGAYYHDRGQTDLAVVHYEHALRLRPDSAHAHYNRGLILLREGNFADGWRDYEWRLKLPKFPLEVMSESLWDGRDPHDRTILVHAEQGMGDTLHFIRYVPLLRARYPRVVMRVFTQLLPLLRQSGFEVYGCDEPLPHFDLQIPLLSLPGILGTTVDNIPATAAYLTARDDLVQSWHARLAPCAGFRVGICWQGNRANKSDESRSIPLAEFAPLARVHGVRLISLQKGDGVEQLAEHRDSIPVFELGDDLDHASGAFMDTAAVIKNLDLVVTADTAIAHLAGGLGVPTWIALSMCADLRWLQRREDSPWYPSVRLFRQTQHGQWGNVFARIAESLAPLAGGR